MRKASDGLAPRHSEDAAANDHLVTVGLASVIGLVLAGTAMQLVGHGFFNDRVKVLNSASDGGLFGFAGEIAVASAALAAWVVLLRLRPMSSVTVALPPILTFLAVDKIWRLHDRIPGWLAFYLPLLAVTFVAVAAIAWRMSARCFRIAAAGLALLLASFLVHQVGEQLLLRLGASTTGWLFQVKAVVKHGAEVAGWSLITLAFAVGLRDRRERRPR
jgi:hypothetical protein